MTQLGSVPTKSGFPRQNQQQKSNFRKPKQKTMERIVIEVDERIAEGWRVASESECNLHKDDYKKFFDNLRNEMKAKVFSQEEPNDILNDA